MTITPDLFEFLRELSENNRLVSGQQRSLRE